MTVTPTITWDQFYHYANCPHRVFLDQHGDPAERDPISDFTRLLWERGVLHEKHVISELEFVEISGPSTDDAITITLDHMHRGAPLIYQGVLRYADMLARPDLLRRVDSAPSKWGPYHYVPIDIKSGRGVDEADNRVRVYALQLRFYAEVLGHVQGYRPKHASIINIDGEEISYPLYEWDVEFHEVLTDLRALAQRKRENLPALGAHCKECHWFTHCLAWASKSQDVSLIYKLGWDAAVRFRDRGITNLSTIAQLDAEAFLRPPLKMKGIGRKSLTTFQQRAEVYLRDAPARYGQLDLPSTRIHVFFDVEDDPTQDVYYLFGLLLITQDGEQYRPFIASNPSEEGETWANFLGYVAELSDYTIYHYSSHEPTVLRRLFRRYDSDPDRVATILGNSVDLLRAVERLSDWPDFSYGLKSIVKRLGFSYRDVDPSGTGSITWYAEYLSDPENKRSVLERIVKYNEDDCRALKLVRDWLAAPIEVGK